MPALDAGDLQGVDEPELVYLTCYKVFQNAQDSRAKAVLQKGYALLTGQIAKIGDQEAIRSFLENVPANRDIGKAWRENQEESTLGW